MVLAPSHPLALTEAAFTSPIELVGGYNLLQLGLAGLAVGGVVYFGVKAIRGATKNVFSSSSN